jgi:PAS domain S-box-containing protein
MTGFRSSDGPAALQIAAVQQMPDAVMILDRAGRIAVWNRAAERLFHLAARDAIGRTPADVNVYPWLTPDAEPAAAGALAEAGTWRGETVHRGGNGHATALESTVSALTDADGRPGGLLAVIRDVTDGRRQPREQSEAVDRLRAPSNRLGVSTGVIPICAHCKRIRDADGSWQEIEIHLGRRLQLRFSHGICPACLHTEVFS